MPQIGPRPHAPVGAANCLRRVACWIWERGASRDRGAAAQAKEKLRAGLDARQESAEMSAGISVRRSLLPKARMAGKSRSQAGMHWSLELALAVLYERCIHAL